MSGLAIAGLTLRLQPFADCLRQTPLAAQRNMLIRHSGAERLLLHTEVFSARVNPAFQS